MINSIAEVLSSLLHRPRVPRVAVFIDADGVSPADAERAIVWAEQRGRVSVLRVYGNYMGQAGSAWTALIGRRAIIARHMPNMARGKNAADVALTVDAVEVLLTRKIDTFVLIVSDTDFVPLATRIREEGKCVLGVGQRSTPETFRSACTEFLDIQSLKHRVTSSAPLWTRDAEDALELVLSVLSKECRDGEPITLSHLGMRLLEQDPGFDPRVYRRRALRDLLSALPQVELIERDGVWYASPVGLRD